MLVNNDVKRLVMSLSFAISLTYCLVKGAGSCPASVIII